MNLTQKFFHLFYSYFAVHLPCAYYRGGKTAKKLRYLSCKRLFAKCGKNVNVEHGAKFSPSIIEIGDNSGIGINCIINGSVKIGKYVMIGPETMIITVNHAHSDISKPMALQGNEAVKPVIIEDDVW